VIVPWQRLSKDALEGVVREFILREGTDYGEREISLANKIGQVMAQLRSEEVVIVFEPESEGFSILSSGEAVAAQAEQDRDS